MNQQNFQHHKKFQSISLTLSLSSRPFCSSEQQRTDMQFLISAQEQVIVSVTKDVYIRHGTLLQL